MSRTGDYSHEMTTPHLIDIDDTTAEALLSGAQVPPELAPVADLVRVLRANASAPVAPTPALAAMLATGEFGDACAPRSPVHRPQGRGLGAAASRTTRTAVRRLAAVPRKLRWVAVGAAAAAGVIGMSGAGFAGALPEPVQQRFETVVTSVTPYEFPARPGAPSEGGRQLDENSEDGGGTGPETGEPAPGPGNQGNGNQGNDNPGHGNQGSPPGEPPPSDPPAEAPGHGQQPDNPGPPDDRPGGPGSGQGPGSNPGQGPGSNPGQGPGSNPGQGQGPPDGPPGPAG